MTNADALAQLKRSLVENAGGYLRNTVHIPGETCSKCRGTRMQDGYHSCYPCSYVYGTCAADLVGTIIYGVDGLQSGKLMFGYKNTPQSSALTQRVSSLVALALRGHTGCASAIVGVPVSHWATVPSLRNIGSAHPFRAILAAILSSGREIEVAATKAAASKSDQERRSLNPGFYELRTGVPTGVHVMVVDDTWTSGGHAQSVALALKQAGAAKVSVLAVARWLDWDERTKRVYNEQIKNRPYDPDICPWTGAVCPPR